MRLYRCIVQVYAVRILNCSYSYTRLHVLHCSYSYVLVLYVYCTAATATSSCYAGIALQLQLRPCVIRILHCSYSYIHLPVLHCSYSYVLLLYVYCTAATATYICLYCTAAKEHLHIQQQLHPRAATEHCTAVDPHAPAYHSYCNPKHCRKILDCALHQMLVVDTVRAEMGNITDDCTTIH